MPNKLVLQGTAGPAYSELLTPQIHFQTYDAHIYLVRLYRKLDFYRYSQKIHY